MMSLLFFSRNKDSTSRRRIASTARTA